MHLSKQMWIGLGVAAAGVGGYLLWPKKASAATPATTPGTTTPTTTTPVTYPPVWTAPPVVPPGSGWTLPPGWIPPAGWVPPWATAPTSAPSSLPGWLTDLFGKTPVTPTGVATVSDDYKAGFNAGMMDAAIYPGKSMTPIAGSNQDASRYKLSPSYKSGYDQGWHDYMSTVTTAGVRGMGPGVGAGVGAGMPQQWWMMLPRAVPQDYGMCSHPETYLNPWRG